jgi:hypothetical protein
MLIKSVHTAYSSAFICVHPCSSAFQFFGPNRPIPLTPVPIRPSGIPIHPIALVAPSHGLAGDRPGNRGEHRSG